MHPDQRAFVEAFKAWDGVAMAGALVRIVEDLGQLACSEETRNELTWSCRQLLEAMEGHPGIRSSVSVPEGPFTLMLAGGVVWAAEGPPARHPKVTLELALRSLESPGLKERWRSLGLVGETLEIDRDEVRTPGVLSGESGYRPNPPGRSSIHRPRQVLPARPSQTYAHALAVEFDAPKPRLDRYRAGYRAAVWEELISLGGGVREGSILPDAVAVARETMRRCRENVERLAGRLRSIGYQFRDPDQAFVPPDAGVLGRIADLERRVGPLPLSLCAWYELVGSVDFTGGHPDWSWDHRDGYPDPLVVLPGDILEYDEDRWYRERYYSIIAPDEYHKEDVSGGPPYTIRLPDPSADGFLDHERHQVAFVEYLRICFRWGTFPGWDRLAEADRPRALLDEMTRGLLAI